MKKNLTTYWGLFLLFLPFVSQASVQLPGFFNDHMVFQRNQSIPVWGWANAGETVTVTLLGKTVQTIADSSGKWTVTLPKAKAGGPYELKINDRQIKDVQIGDVYLCSGQSNMELPVHRCLDLYKEEVEQYTNLKISYVQIDKVSRLQGPGDDIGGKWQPVTPATAPGMSALCYFMAKEVQERHHVPVGIINASFGGSPIEAWMNQPALKKFTAEKIDFSSPLYTQTDYIDSVQRTERQRTYRWYKQLCERDSGLGRWNQTDYNDSQWTKVDMFSEWSFDKGVPVAGSHWLRQTIIVPADMSGLEAVLRLGTMVDADSAFLNGQFIGCTPYQYPPRKYNIPAGLLRAGANQLTVRIVNSAGPASFVKDMPYQLICNGQAIELSATWKYHLGVRMPLLKGNTNFAYTPTGLYNGMIAPLRNYPVCGAVWYQGESNTGKPQAYASYIAELVDSWRKQWGCQFPFVIVQLANFMNHHDQPYESNWAALREAQRLAANSIPEAGLATAIDIGLWNDIHPLNKKELGHRVALQMDRLVYREKCLVAEGPAVEKAVLRKDGIVEVSFRKRALPLQVIGEITGISLAGTDGRYYWAKTIVQDDKLLVSCDQVKVPVSIRYAWDDNPNLCIFNRQGLPAPPFCLAISSENK